MQEFRLILLFQLAQYTNGTATFKGNFTLQMLLETTNNFSEDHKIRTSSFGSVYRATLDDGREVAIKRAEISMSKPYVSKHYSDDAFLNELKLCPSSITRILFAYRDLMRIVMSAYWSTIT